MREINFTRRIIITLLVLYIILQLLVYFNCLLLVKDLETVINAHAGRYGGRIDINRLIIVSKEYGIYEDAYKTAFTKIGIALSVLVVYIIYIYRTKNNTQLLKDAMLLIKEQKITESKQKNQ